MIRRGDKGGGEGGLGNAGEALEKQRATKDPNDVLRGTTNR